MRNNARVSSAAMAVAVLGLAAATFALACGSDAAGVDACRQIEAARCEASTACNVSEADSTYCVSFYQDQCLHGFAKSGSDPSDATTAACVEAIRAVAACARAGAQTMAQCPTISLAAGTNAATLPCTIIKQTPQDLSACAFLTPTAVTLPTPDAATD